MKPLLAQPITKNGSPIATAYQFSFGWAAEWIHFDAKGELTAKPFTLPSKPDQHDLRDTFEEIEREVLRTHAHLVSKGMAFSSDPPTREVRFSGASDDLVYVQGCVGEDEYGAYGHGRDICATFALEAYGGAVHVNALYAGRGVWSFSVSQIDPDAPLPPWPIRLEVGGRGYSADLIITAPMNAKVRRLGEDDDDE